MKHFRLIIILIISISCSSNQQDKKVERKTTHDSSDTIDLMLQADTAAINSNRGYNINNETIDLHLNGIYEYVYPHNTENLIENHYIAFRKTGELVEGWYYGTSDEFDEAREGYLPGFFVSKIEELRTSNDSLFFKISTGYNKCYSKAFPIGYIDSSRILKSNKIWNSYNEDYLLDYSGKLTGLKITMTVNGDTRVFKKRKNYFHIGIDNFDKTKCQSEPLLAITENIENLNDTLILDFLSSFSVICENNVEFSEWSNELLFKVMAKEPEKLIRIFVDNASQLDTAAILKELDSPLHDLIDLEQIKEKISMIDIDKEIKGDIIKRLENK